MICRPLFQWIALLLALCAYAWLAVWKVWPAINNNDFKHIFFGMKALLDGNSPYPIQSLHHQAALQGYQALPFNPYVYLPFTGQTMAFLAPLSLDQAVAVWFTLNHLFVAGSVAIISQMFPRCRIGAAAMLYLSLAFSTPLYRTLTAGQLNLALLFLICLGWHLAHNRKSVWTGAVLAFAALFKLMPGIYGVYFLLRRQWLSLASMIVSGSLMLLLSVLVAGPQLYQEFLPVLQQMSYGNSTWPHVFSFWDDPPNQSLNSLFSHLMTRNDHTVPWYDGSQAAANVATALATGSLLLAYIYLLWGTCPKGKTREMSPADEAAWISTLILGLLVPSLLWDHYLVMLIFPTAWMVKAAMEKRKHTAAVVALCCYAVTCIPWNYDSQLWRVGLAVPLMSLKLYPTLLLFGLSLCFVYWHKENVYPATSDAPESIEA